MAPVHIFGRTLHLKLFCRYSVSNAQPPSPRGSTTLPLRMWLQELDGDSASEHSHHAPMSR